MKPLVFSVIVLLCALLLNEVNSSKILVITSMPAHSHFTLTFRLAKELADRGHQVTFINPYPQKTPIKNLNEISLQESLAFVNELRKTFLDLGNLGPLGSHLIDLGLSAGITEHAFNNTRVQKLLNSNETFDLTIIEHFLNEALVGIGHHFRTPIIFLAPVPSCFRNNYLFGNPSPSSYVPDILGTYGKHMNFWQRLKNFVTITFHDLFRELAMLPKQRELFKKYTNTELELDDVLYNISLILTLSHPSVTHPVPHLPNIVEIGGYHLFPPKPLPRDIKEFLDSATEGVVFFSMGSNLNSKDFKLDTRKAILNAFSKIKAKVLWKFEAELPEAPENVKILKWLPQQDVLAHPNIRAFITHGGLLSTIEGAYYGVPLIGIPVFGDQRSNIVGAIDDGYALSTSLEEITEESFLSILNEILNNPKYRTNAQHRSKLIHDQPLKPIDSAVYWIEYVIRHKGAPHLRSAGIDLHWYQREMVDIFAFLTLTVIIFSSLTYFLVVAIVKKILCKNKTVKIKVSSKKKKN